MIAQQLAGKAIRDAFFLANYQADTLPTVVMVASLLSVGAVFGATYLYRTISPARILPMVFSLSGLWFIGEWGLSRQYPGLIAISLYIHTTSFGSVVVSGFWSVVNECFDPHSARRIIGQIATGATVGGMLGGLAAWQSATFLPLEEMILAIAITHFICALSARQLQSAEHTESTSETTEDMPPPSIHKIMDETPYLWHLAALVAISALAASIFDYVFKARASDIYSNAQDLISFFSVFYLVLGFSTFAFQRLFSSLSLKYLGLSATVGLMPFCVFILSGVAFLFQSFWSALVLRAVVAILESSLYRSGYELLYTPLTPPKKRSTKALIDVGGDKLGAATGGAITLVVLAALPAQANQALLGLSAVCGLIALVVTRALHRGYVASLEESLSTGAVPQSTLDIIDATTKVTVERTLAKTHGDVNRVQLEEVSQALIRRTQTPPQAAGAGVSSPGPASSTTHPLIESPLSEPIDQLPPYIDPNEQDHLIAAINALRSKHPQRVQQALKYFSPLPLELTPHVVPLLVEPKLGAIAFSSLKKVVAVQSGLLSDFMNSERTELRVRRYMPRLFETIPNQRSVDILSYLLDTSILELRLRAARGIRNITKRNPSTSIHPERVIAAVQSTLLDINTTQHLSGPKQEESTGHALVLCFTLLSSILPTTPLYLALNALNEVSTNRQGTGREYLENVLPPEVKPDLLQLLTSPILAQSATQSEAEVIKQLEKSYPIDAPSLPEIIRQFSPNSGQSGNNVVE